MLRNWLLASWILCATWAGAQTNCNEGAGPLDSAIPANFVPNDAIHAFAGNEALFEQARRSYGFTQDMTVQTLGGAVTVFSRPGGKSRFPRPGNKEYVTGEFRMVADISYDNQGRRIEKVTYAPQNTLRSVVLTREDLDDLRNMAGFILTTHELPRYNIRYAGTQHVDELDTYAFDVTPAHIEKGQRYFEGRIWIEARDLVIVKTCGRGVPDQKGDKHHEPNLSPKFVTYREQIDGKYWFPTYSGADEVLPFAQGPVHIRETVKFSAYRRTGASTPGSGVDAVDRARNRQSPDPQPPKNP
jgi:hypothetical protein